MNKKCPKCGYDGRSKFCPECGAEMMDIGFKSNIGNGTDTKQSDIKDGTIEANQTDMITNTATAKQNNFLEKSKQAQKKTVIFIAVTIALIALAIIIFLVLQGSIKTMAEAEQKEVFDKAISVAEGYGLQDITVPTDIPLEKHNSGELIYEAHLSASNMKDIIGDEMIEMHKEMPGFSNDGHKILWYYHENQSEEYYYADSFKIYDNNGYEVYEHEILPEITGDAEDSEEADYIDEEETEAIDNSDDNSTSMEKRDKSELTEEEIFMAMAIAEKEIKNKLTYDVKKAKFSHSEDDWYISEQDWFYTVSTTFEAPNEYGTMHKAGAVVSFTVTSKDSETWKYKDASAFIEWQN